MKLSIIIPVYNGSSTILRCLDSIYKLSISDSDFEVILVDDCSLDDSLKKAKDYALNHSNMIVLHQQHNHRQGAARNRGVSIAKGDYIAFVDADDMVDYGLISALNIAVQLKLDMVVMGKKRLSIDGRNMLGNAPLIFADGQLFSGIEMQIESPFFAPGPVAYLYSSIFLQYVNYPFCEDVLYEDTDFVNVHLYKAKRMSYCKDCGYIYIDNSSSTTHNFTPNSIADYFLLGTRMLNFYQTLEDKTDKYAFSILEGGSFNIMKAFKRLYRLQSMHEIKETFSRIDNHYDRKSLLCYREPEYCWNLWTRTCLKHKNVSIILANMVRIGYKFKMV